MNPRTGKRYQHIGKTFRRAVQQVGLTVPMDGVETTLRFHDLRHVFATWLHQAGASLDSLRPLMGHKNRDTTDRYATLNNAHTGKILDKLPRIRKVG